MFAQPWILPVLLLVPALLTAYLWQLRRRRRVSVVYSDVSLVRVAAGRTSPWRRHAPIALVLGSLALLGLAAARPQVEARVPVSGASVILALDVSGSMCATDVEPNRLTAAQAAVRRFVESQDEQTKVGLVLFSGFASLVVAPTTERGDLLTAIDGATTGRGTTIGSAILTSIDAISELDPSVAPSDRERAPAPDGSSLGTDEPGTGPTGPTGPAGPAGRTGPTGAGSAAAAPEIVVLLTDGANTRGVMPAEAAAQAAARGVRVYPIGFGTTRPTQMVCTAAQAGVGGFTGGLGGGSGSGRARDGAIGAIGGRSFLVVDEPALQEVAKTTGGEYFAATDADQLARVLTDLPQHVEVRTQEVDLSVWFTVAAAAVLVLGLGLSLRWSSPLG